ncbi:hypothetical protein [Pseudomonas sp. HY13-MNA-CIBAN-0226]|uniref:hypothetical protein n=1 Tax=Pseudomonas sp. HY13-MNA-CIBAN-0226 TaxID=3140473 RepID=UPI00332D74AA
MDPPPIDDGTDTDLSGDCDDFSDCEVDDLMFGYVALCGHSEHQPAWTGDTQKDLNLAQADVLSHKNIFPSHQPFAVSSESAEEIVRCWQMQDMENDSRIEITDFQMKSLVQP